jgi:hypothetical protein
MDSEYQSLIYQQGFLEKDQYWVFLFRIQQVFPMLFFLELIQMKLKLILKAYPIHPFHDCIHPTKIYQLFKLFL